MAGSDNGGEVDGRGDGGESSEEGEEEEEAEGEWEVEEKDLIEVDETPNRERWDCESFLR